MRDECEQAMEAVLGRALKPGESRDVEDMVNLQMRLLARSDPQGWLAMAPQERLQAGAKAAAEAIIADLRLKQQRVTLQIAAHDRIDSTIQAAFSKLPANAKGGARLKIVSETLAFEAAGRGGTMSADSWAHSIANNALGELMPLWNGVKGFAGLFENREGVSALIHELFGEDSGNAAARAGAKAWMTVTEKLRDRGNNAGMDIGKLEDWRYPQSWSQSRVATAANGDAKASLAAWQAKMLPLLDRDRYLNPDGGRMSDEQVTRVLAQVFDSITTDGQNKREPGMPQVGGSVANRLSAHRALFFKDADSYLTAQGLYGEGTLWNALTGHVRAIARDIGLAETLGPNAEQTFRYFNDRTRTEELRAQPAQKDKINSQSALNESIYDYVSGRRQVVNDKVAAIAQSWRNFQTAAKLGNVVITALGDEAGMSATAFANRVPWSESMMRELHYMNPAKASDRDVAGMAGLGINSAIGGLNRFGYEDMQLDGGDGTAGKVRDFTSKLATGTLHASGAEYMWDTRRKALGSVLMSYLGKWTREVQSVEDLNWADHGILTTKGVTDADWQVWRRAELEDWGMRHGVLTPKAIEAIPDEALADLAHLGDPDALRRHASTLLLGHVLEETGMGVMDTGARERAGMFMGTQSGTAIGELARSGFLFKSFAWSMMNKHWARAAAMPSGTQTAAYVARLVVTGTVMGALSVQLHNLVAGRDPGNVAEPRFWGEALLKGGGLGFYGDFLYDEMSSKDASLIPAIAGPLATEAEQIGQLTLGAAFKAARGERTDEGAKVLRFLRGDAPFLNMWYTKTAIDHLVWNEMQEAASPGYLERMQNKAYAQRGTTYYWEPGESSPHAGPDFAKIWNPDLGREQMQRIADATGFSAPSE